MNIKDFIQHRSLTPSQYFACYKLEEFLSNNLDFFLLIFFITLI